MMRADGGEPQLQDVCTNDSDRMILRNIIYTIWALHRSSGGGSNSSSSSSSHHHYLVCPSPCVCFYASLYSFL